MIWPLGEAGPRPLRLLWRGRDSALFMRLVGALRQGGIPFHRTRVRGYEALPPALSRWALFPLPVFRVCVHPQNLAQAREILRQLIQSNAHP